MASFGAGIARSFNPRSTANLISNLIIQNSRRDDVLNRQLEYNQAKQDIAQEQFSQDTSLLAPLLTGQTMTPYPVHVARDITPEEKVGYLLGLSQKGINRYNDLNKIVNPKKEYKEVGGSLFPMDAQGNVDFQNPVYKKPTKYSNYDFSKKEGVYAVNEDTNQLELIQQGNPVYRPKIVTHKFGEDEQGNQVLKTFYEDGTTVTRETGLNPDGSITPRKFNKALDAYVPRLNQLFNLRSKYANPDLGDVQKGALREQVSNIAFNEEQSLYNSFPTKLQKIIDKHYTDLTVETKKNKVDLGQFESQNQEALQNQFMKTITESFASGKLDSNEYRALALWSKFKFGYLPPWSKPTQ